MTPTESGKSAHIFISYRRDETAYPAGWLYDRLTEHFGEGSVFKDLDSIEFGDDFTAAIATAVAACDVLLALIGERWVTMTDEHGQRRLDQPDDFVRREIEAALTRDVRVIPILVDRARMPRVDELPPSLAPLVRRQAMDISPSRFESDTARLIAVLRKTLDEEPAHSGATDRAAPASSRRTRVALAVGAALTLLATALIITTSRSAPLGTGTSSEPTTAQTAAPTTPRSVAPGTVIAADDFSSTANGWAVSAVSPHGDRLVNGKYRLSVDPAPGGTGAGAFPRDAPGIYPVAPSNVVVEVTGTRLASSETQMEYGVMCRANNDPGFGYFLTLSNRYAEINKSSPDAEFQQLARRPLPVEAGVAHRLRAECRNEDGSPTVHLSLSVDDRPLVEYVDRIHPIAEGCVGLWIGMDTTARSTGEAEFEDFTVRAD